MCLKYPELAKDKSFKTNLGLKYHRDNPFNEQVQMATYQKRTEFITGLGELKTKMGEAEVPYFDNGFLIERFLGLNPDLIRLNEKYKKKDEKEAEKIAKQAEAAGEGAEGGDDLASMDAGAI